MSDIAKLETRISNLEYYTSLNALDKDATSQFIPDANGNNRFKSGIFVDNFSTTLPQDTNIGFKNSVDKKSGSMRPCITQQQLVLVWSELQDKILILMKPLLKSLETILSDLVM